MNTLFDKIWDAHGTDYEWKTVPHSFILTGFIVMK